MSCRCVERSIAPPGPRTERDPVLDVVELSLNSLRLVPYAKQACGRLWLRFHHIRLVKLICALTRGYRPGGANCGTIVAPLCLQKLVTSLIQISLLSLLESVSRVGPQGIRDVIQHHAVSLVHCFMAFKDFSSDVFPGGFRLSSQSCLEQT